jgi:hypothetical protein
MNYDRNVIQSLHIALDSLAFIVKFESIFIRIDYKSLKISYLVVLSLSILIRMNKLSFDHILSAKKIKRPG